MTLTPRADGRFAALANHWSQYSLWRNPMEWFDLILAGRLP